MKVGTYPILEFNPRWDFDVTSRSGSANRMFLQAKKVGFTLNVCCGTDRINPVERGSQGKQGNLEATA